MPSVRKSAIWSIFEFGTNVFIQFFVMKYIVSRLGVSALGIWSVLIASVQLAKLFDPGAAAGSARFLSLAQADGDIDQVQKILGSTFFTTAGLYLGISASLYWPIKHLLELVMHGDALDQGRNLLIYAVGSYVFQVCSNVYSSALVALHLGYWKSRIVIAGAVLQLVLSLTLIGSLGLAGLAIAQICNYVLVALASLLGLKYGVGVRILELYRWDTPTFRRVTSFGVGVQLISILSAAFEMSIRFIMSRFGGIEQVGYYEIAYKIATQTKILAFYVAQPLSATLTALTKQTKSELRQFYRLMYSRFSLYAVLASLAIVVCSPLTSLIMLGSIQPRFLGFSLLTAIGSASLIVAIPPEITAVASGKLRQNMTSTVSALVILAVLGVVLGSTVGAVGVALAVMIGSVVSAILAITLNSRALDLPLMPRWRRDLRLTELLRSGRPA